jgi:cytochrome c551/c552
MLSLDCKTCHKETDSSVGPSFLRVAGKYAQQPEAVNYLVQKIISGGKGVWGEAMMPAHPTIPVNDLRQVTAWILSLAKKEEVKKSLPVTGTITPVAGQQPGTVLVLTASYTDKGNNNTKALTGTNSLILPGNDYSITGKEEVLGFRSGTLGGAPVLLLPDTTGGWLGIGPVDLTGVRAITLISRWRNAPEAVYTFEIRADAPDGKLLGTGSLPVPKKGQQQGNIRVALQPVSDNSMHKLYFIYSSKVKKIQAGISGLVFSAR